MNILITGGAGFIGSHLVDALVTAGHRCTVVDNLSSGTKNYINPEAEFIEMDIRDEKIQALFSTHHFDTIYHEAAQTLVPASLDNPHYDADENIMGMLNILEGARKNDVEKVIFSSSAAIYGDNPHLPLIETELPAPESFYGLTKWMTERYLSLYHEFYGLHYTVLRYSNVYGPRQGAHGEGGVVYIFAKALANHSPITIFGDGKQTRDFISVHDVIAANISALTKGNEEICNVSTGTELTLNDLAKEMLTLAGCEESLLSHSEERPGDIYRSSLSTTHAKEILHWEAQINLRDGLRETIKFFQK